MSMMNAPRPAVLTLAVAAAFVPAARSNSESPIDIRSDRSVHAPLPALQFNFPPSTTLTLVNSGTPDPILNVRANVPAGAGSVTVAGDTFRLQQFHFHVPSEHKLNGVSFPMELHMVTQNAAGTTMVVGRFIEEGADNRAFNALFRRLPGKPAAEATVADFDLNALLPTRKLGSFRYRGSLTAPPFGAGVNWVVLADPLILSATQIGAFAKLFGPDGNHRRLHPLDGRIVRTDVPGFAPVPGPESHAAAEKHRLRVSNVQGSVQSRRSVP